MKKKAILFFLLFCGMGSLLAGRFGESVAGSFLGSTLSNVMWKLPRQRSYRSSDEAARGAMNVARDAHTIAVDAHRGAVRFERDIKDLEEEISRLRREIKNLREEIDDLKYRPSGEVSKKRWWWPF